MKPFENQGEYMEARRFEWERGNGVLPGAERRPGRSVFFFLATKENTLRQKELHKSKNRFLKDFERCPGKLFVIPKEFADFGLFGVENEGAKRYWRQGAEKGASETAGATQRRYENGETGLAFERADII